MIHIFTLNNNGIFLYFIYFYRFYKFLLLYYKIFYVYIVYIYIYIYKIKQILHFVIYTQSNEILCDLLNIDIFSH